MALVVKHSSTFACRDWEHSTGRSGHVRFRAAVKTEAGLNVGTNLDC